MNSAKNRWFALLTAVIVCLITAALVRGQAPSPTLLGQPVQRELKGGATQVHALTLAAGTYLNLTITYQGLSTDVTLIHPNGQRLAERLGTAETLGSAEIAVIVSAAGNHQIVVRGRGVGTGKYKLEVNELRPATEQDQQYLTAHQLREEGTALVNLRTADGRRRGLTKFREALPLWRASGEFTQELETLRLISDTQFVLGEFRPAMEAAQELLTKARAAGLRNWELKGLKYVGLLHNSLNEYQATRQTLEPALVLSRELKERLEERAILNGLGIAVAALGQRHAAIAYYQQALQIAREIGDRSGEATMMRNLAVRYESIGEPDQAVAYFQQALALRRELGLRDSEASTLLDLSRIQLRQGEMQQALTLAEQSRTLLQAAGRKDDEAFALEHLSRIHYEMHELDLARSTVNQALTFYRGNQNRKQEANCLRLLSSIDSLEGNTAEAQALLQQAITLHRRVGTPQELMTDLFYLGKEYAAQGNLKQALAHYAESTTLSREINSLSGEAQAALQASRAHQALQETDKADELLQRVLTLSRTIKNSLLEAEAGHDLAQLQLRHGNAQAAQTQIEAALKMIETSRNHLTNPALRADYLSRKQSYYEIYVEALLRQAEQRPEVAAQALAVVERARARSLLDLLAESRIDIRQGVDGELLNRERILQQRLAAKAELLQRLGTQKNAQEQTKLLEAEITTLTAELRAAESNIRSASPAYAALTQPQPLQLTDIQQQVLDRDTLLLEYALGAERSYLFAVTPTTLKVFTLPKRADIEAAAQRWHERLSQRGQAPVFSNLTARQKWLTQLERDTTAAADALSRLIVQPAAAEMKGKRLLIVPDGILHYVPFAALPLPVVGHQLSVAGKKTVANRPPTTDHRPPLIVEHEILTLPSASTMALLRRERAQRQPAPLAVAILADPVFEPNDERIKLNPLAASKPLPLTTDLRRSAAEIGAESAGSRFLRLPYTRTEAQAIQAAAPKSTTMVALDFAANREAVLNGELARYRYVHFATHGLLNNVHPELSGVVLSLVDEKGQPQNGFLRTMDVFNLKLKAELVVLSGCRTGLGKDVRGEGLLGLTRGFMYAGANRVMASLWQVDDEATAELMQRFYRQLLSENKVSPAAALRAAQLQMLRDPRRRTPYYWAAFTMQGEW